MALESEVELGGTDQLFNSMVGRDLTQRHGQKPQIVMTTPILERIDARMDGGRVVRKKMSKYADNYVGLTESRVDMFRKCMQIDDRVIWRFYELLSSLTFERIAEERSKADPIAAKARLARAVLARFHAAAAAHRELCRIRVLP